MLIILSQKDNRFCCFTKLVIPLYNNNQFDKQLIKATDPLSIVSTVYSLHNVFSYNALVYKVQKHYQKKNA
jgi:hypothetical protein